MNRLLDQKVVVIVGGTTGLGLSAARACVREGARVVLVGRSVESGDAALGELRDAAAFHLGDATVSSTAADAIEFAFQTFDGFDALYHVAGGSGRRFGDGPLHELSDEAVPKTLELNLASVIYSNRAAVQSFLSRERNGVVLNMGSVLGQSPAPDFFATHVYAAAKAGIAGFTRSCAAYYATRGIRFNVIAPALVETPMSGRAVNDPAILHYVQQRQPLDGGRVGLPTDLDDAVTFLLSEASVFVTGQVLSVDGGWSVSDAFSGES